LREKKCKKMPTKQLIGTSATDMLRTHIMQEKLIVTDDEVD
jgi:hypothetical protein